MSSKTHNTVMTDNLLTTDAAAAIAVAGPHPFPMCQTGGESIEWREITSHPPTSVCRNYSSRSLVRQ